MRNCLGRGLCYKITQTETLIIPHFLREPKSIIVLFAFPKLSLEEGICIFPHLAKKA